MNDSSWLEHLESLVTRFTYMGVNTDIASLSLIELWGIYCYLSRLAEN